MAQPANNEAPVINASDIGRYVFCRRAWWYDQQGYTPANQGELRRGRRLHVSYDLLVRGVQALGVIAVLLLIGGVFLAALYFLQMAAGAG